MSCYLNLLPASDPQWGLFFSLLPLIYNPVSHHVMTSPRVMYFINTHTHHNENRINPRSPWALHRSTPAALPSHLLFQETTWHHRDRATHLPSFTGLKARGGFCATPAYRQHCTLVSSCPTLTALSLQGSQTALHSEMIYAVCFWQQDTSNPLETGWNQSCLLHHSVQAQAGEANGQRTHEQCTPPSSVSPRPAAPTRPAQDRAPGFPHPTQANCSKMFWYLFVSRRF